MLRVEHLKIGTLPQLSFEVADGECLAIEGPSGSGKTRLLRGIADLDPAPGQVFLDGIERHEMSASEWRKSVRFVAAEPGWWTDTARPAFPPGGRAARLLSDLGLTEDILDRPIATLSTGERQRMALVRAIVDDPKVLLLDEPTGALDIRAAALVEEVLRYLMLAGRTVLLASHDGALVARLAHARLQLARPNTSAKP